MTSYNKRALRCGVSIVALTAGLSFSGQAFASALPSHGHFVSGQGSIAKGNQSLTVKQSSTTGIIDWNSFSVGKGNGVSFNNGSGATLNRVTGGNLSTIAGSLHATGSLYLMNSSGVIVSGTGHIVTGGNFVATSGNIANSAFGDGDRRFKLGAGNIINKGTIVSGGSASLIGRNVSDSGSIRATGAELSATQRLGISGSIVARNSNGSGGAVIARAGTIVIGTDGDINASASGAGQKGGTISVVARGTTTVAGTLSANGGSNGSGGFIDTSGEHLHVADGAKISTLAANGKTGTWLIDPNDFTIAASGGDITGATLSSELNSNDILIQSITGANAGNGDIIVDDAVSWSSGFTLTLDAYRNIDVNAPITISGAGGLKLIDADQTQISGTPGSHNGSVAGDLIFGSSGNIAFTDIVDGNTTQLSINEQAYTLENDISGLAAAITGDASGFYALANNYDATGDGTYSHSPIQTDFTGTFEGLGNTISNLTINDSSDADVGLFQTAHSGATIRDIGLENANVTGTSTAASVGGLVGANSAAIESAHVSGTVTGGSQSDVGGLAGLNSGSIENSYSSAAIDSNDSANAGGLVGDDEGTIESSYATGAVTGDSTSAGGLAGNLGADSIETSYATGAVTDNLGAADVGGFVGQNYDGTITQSHATGAVVGGGTNAIVGGFVGQNYDAITQSWASGNVSGGASANVGGFAGENGYTITQSEASGDVSGAANANVGGFIGTNDYTMSDNYSTGSATGGSGATVGGFVGLNPFGFIDESYETGAATGDGGSVGGFAGSNDSSNGYLGATTAVYFNSNVNSSGVGSGAAIAQGGGLSRAQMQSKSSFSGWTFGTTGGGSGWVIVDLDGSLNNTGSTPTGGTTPMLLSEYSTTIYNAHQLQLMALNLSASYTLANDVDATATDSGGVWGSNGFVPIGTGLSTGVGEFTGSLDGQNHVIDGLFIDSDPTGKHSELSWVGLFGAMGGTVENLGLSNVNITGNNDEGFEFPGIGALAGWSFGTISNVWSSGSVKATQADDANAIVGGLVGQFETGSISNSHSSATVSDTGIGGAVGGLIGENSFASGATVTNSYATGNVSSGDNGDVGGFIGGVFGTATITDSYATGSVTEGNSGWAGGFVGLVSNQNSTISRSFALGNVFSDGNAGAGGFAGDIDGTVSEDYAGGNVSKLSGAASGGDLGGFTGGVDGPSVVTKSYSTGSVTGDSTATLGGFAASNGGNIDESYTLSKVTGGDPSATGAFVGSNNTAGNIGASVSDYYDGDINGALAGFGETSGSGAIVALGALTTTQMHTATNFAGWTGDFGTTAGGDGWVIVDTNGSLNNASGVGGTTPMLLSEWSNTIVNAHQLQLMELDPTQNYTLVGSIDASGTGNGADVWGSQGFIAIGGNNSSGNFTGTFDGQGHTISNLFIDDTTNATVGLFGYMSGTAENVGLIATNVTSSKTLADAGGLAGFSAGSITQSYATGEVSGGAGALVGGLVGTNSGTITQSYATSAVNGGGNVGGLVGDNAGTIGESYAAGAVTVGADGDAGGLAGENFGAITLSYATGAVSGVADTYVGGLVGYNSSGMIDESYELGAATGGTGADVGGLIGQNDGTAGATTAVYFNSSVNSGSGVGADAAIAQGGGLTAAQMRNKINFAGWTFGTTPGGSGWVIVDLDESLNNASGATGGTTPMLLSEYSTSIANAHQLQLMQLDPTANYTVIADIDASGTQYSADVWSSDGFVPVGGLSGFSGTFNGGDHTISGLFISQSEGTSFNTFVGLFTSVDEGASASNVTLANVKIAASGSDLTVGALAGVSLGMISNVTVSGSVSGSGSASSVGGLVGTVEGGSIADATSSASVSASNDIDGNGAGGLVGFNDFGTITQSSASGNVSVAGDDVGAGGLVGINGGTISQSFATGNVTLTDSATTSGNVAGGLVGANDGGVISNSYAMGNVTMSGGATSFGGGFAGSNENGGSIADSYSLGTVSAAIKGGFVGLEQSSTIANSYWDTQTSGLSHGVGSGGSTGVAARTTAQLEAALPAGFGGSDWSIVAGTSLPYLSWQFSGTPQVVSGLTLSGFKGTGVGGLAINLVDDGNAINSALGNVVSYANGYYYFLLAPGSIANGDQILAYRNDDNGASFFENATGSIGGLNIAAGYFSETLTASKMSTADMDLGTATDGNSAASSAVSDTTNTFVDSIATNFDFDAGDKFGTTFIFDQQSGSVTESTANIDTTKLLLLGDANYTLANSSNSFSTLAMSGTGSLALTDGQALTIGTVAGVNGVDAGGGVGITTTSGGISITELLEADQHPLELTSAGTISESGSGKIKATTLSGVAHGAVTLASAKNVITDLGAFTTSGNNAFSLTDDHALTTTGTVNAGQATLTLKTVSKHGIAVNSKLKGGTVDLVSAGTITENSVGDIDTTTLVGSAHGAVTLASAKNTITDLGAFATGGNNFSLTDDNTLTTTGTVSTGKAKLTLTTLSKHNIAVKSALKGKTVNLASAGTITETISGDIDATTLMGSAHGTVNLTSAKNEVADLGSFTTNGNKIFSFVDDDALTVTGAVDTGTAALSLTTVGTKHNLIIHGSLTGGTVGLVTTGATMESAGASITANKLNVTASSGITLTSTHNAIKKLGTDKTNSGANKVTL